MAVKASLIRDATVGSLRTGIVTETYPSEVNGVASELGVPMVSGYHIRFGDLVRHYFLGFAGGLIGRWLKRIHNKTAAFVVPIEQLRESLVDVGYRNVKILRRSVDTEFFNSCRLKHAQGFDGATPACRKGAYAFPFPRGTRLVFLPAIPCRR